LPGIDLYFEDSGKEIDYIGNRLNVAHVVSSNSQLAGGMSLNATIG